MRRWRSALRLLNSPIGGARLSRSLGLRDGTGFYRFHCPGIDRRRTVGRPGHVSHPRRNFLPRRSQSLREQNKSMTQDDNTVKIRELVDRQVQAWEKHDFGIAAPDWLPSGELISPGGHVPAEEMQTAMAGYFKQFRDLRITVKNVFISNDGAKAAIEWDWDVTRRRDGARAVTRDAIIVDLVGGRISSWREYFDFGNSIDAKP